MTVVVIIFMIVASIFALGAIGYMTVDLILEKRGEAKPEKKVENITPPVLAESPAAASEEVMPEIVEHIDAAEADEMISDRLAMSTVRYESPAGDGLQDIININALNENFQPHDVVTLAALKEKDLISQRAKRMKVLADGTLAKPLTVKAEAYSIQAIKMIELTGGTVIILKD